MEKPNFRSIIHLEKDGKHEYFGSPAALYDKYTAEQLGISHPALNNYFYKLDKEAEPVYTNKICIIRKGKLYVKGTTRKQGKD